jgi:hypothetical protein
VRLEMLKLLARMNLARHRAHDNPRVNLINNRGLDLDFAGLDLMCVTMVCGKPCRVQHRTEAGGGTL